MTEDSVLSPINDWIFKLLFGDIRFKSVLIDLLQSFIDLPDEEYELILLDPYLKPEFEDDKMGILDVKIETASGKIIDIEIQIYAFAHIGKRISFYKSKLIIEQIGKSEGYNVIERVICILITNYTLFKETGDYVNRFKFINGKNGFCFEDIPEEIYTVELPKIPLASDGTKAWDWMRFFNARRKEEFEMAAQTNGEIRKAVDRLYELSADAEVRARSEYREKALRDYITLMEDKFLAGKQEGIAEGQVKGRLEGILEGQVKEKAQLAGTLIKNGFGLEQVVQFTGLDPDTVKKLYAEYA